MAEVSQYMFKHAEVVTALIKAQGLHSGLWQLSINFGFSAANIGSNDHDLNPSVVIPVQGIGLNRVDAEVPPNSLVIDAAIVNPKLVKTT